MPFNKTPNELVNIANGKNIQDLGDWSGDLFKSLKETGDIQKRLDSMLTAFSGALKLMEGGDAEYTKLKAALNIDSLQAKVKIGLISKDLLSEDLNKQKDAILSAYFFVLDTPIKNDPARATLRSKVAKHWADSLATSGSFRAAKTQPWDDLEKLRNASTRQEATSSSSSTQQTGNNNSQTGTRSLAFLIHNPYQTDSRIKEDDIQEPAPIPERIPGKEIIEETYYARNLKTLATSQEPKAKKSDQSVKDLSSGIQAMINKIFEISTHQADKPRAKISTDLSKNISQMSMIDRAELAEILGLDGNSNTFTSTTDKDGNIKITVKNKASEDVMAIDFNKGPDGVWKTIKVSAVGSNLEYGTELAAQVTRKLGQTLTTRDGKPILTAKVEGDTVEKLVDAAYDLIFNKNVPVWDERGKTDNLALVEKYKSSLEARKGNPDFPEDEKYKLHQIDTIFKFIKTSTTTSAENSKQGVNPFRLANAIEELADTYKSRVLGSENLAPDFKSGLIASAKKAIENSHDIQSRKGEFDIEDMTVEYAVPVMDVVLTGVIKGKSIPYNGPIPTPIQEGDRKVIRRTTGKSGPFKT